MKPGKIYNFFFRPLSPLHKVDQIKQKHSEQLQKFEQWASAKDWKLFTPTYSHYDWWMFPVARPSSHYGDIYQVSQADVDALKADPKFMKEYRRGVELVVRSWGWDLQRQCSVLETERTPEQRWTGYGVRLGKMADSLLLFGEDDLYRKLQLFYQAICCPLLHQMPLEHSVKEALSHKDL